jgi:hypothetical protein
MRLGAHQTYLRMAIEELPDKAVADTEAVGCLLD